MSSKQLKRRGGFTLVELVLAMVLALIVISSTGIILVDSQRGWHRMYNKIYSDVVTDSYVARATFDSVVRKASGENYLLSETGNWVEVYYYADTSSTTLDRYALFYYEYDGQLNVEYGSLDPRQTLDVQTICNNVTNCTFEGSGRSVQMVLTLDDGSQSATVVTSAVMHN
jgi:prepilin-type N-terminal cleavage/methylation domain-containing protein